MKTQDQVDAFIEACQKHGFSFEVGRSIVRIKRDFEPGDIEAFIECDMFAGSVLSLAPLRGGSIWGTDGNSVGGHVAIKRGQFVMNKSGEGSRFLKALAKAKA